MYALILHPIVTIRGKLLHPVYTSVWFILREPVCVVTQWSNQDTCALLIYVKVSEGNKVQSANTSALTSSQ